MAADTEALSALMISKALKLADSGLIDEASAIFSAALEQTPDNSDLLYEYGNLLFDAGQLSEAADCFRRQLALDPADASAVLMLGRVLHRLKRPGEALHYFRQGQRLVPHLPIVHLMAGIMALKSHLPEEAKAAFRQVLAIEPDNLSARFCLCMSLLEMFPGVPELERGRCAYEQALRELTQSTHLDTQENIDRAVETAGMMSTFFLPYQGQNDCELQSIYGRWLCRVMAAKYPQYGLLQVKPPAKGEKIRIGMVSGHLSNHSVWKIIARGWCKYLDRKKFMLFCYYTGDICDASTDDARAYSDLFVKENDISVMAEMISRHKPHVLIYPGLSMEPHTIRLAALRLAPVQCVSWGHPTTTGLPTMDYFLSSELMEPPDGDQHYSEQLVRLPNLSICYEPLPLPAELPPTKIPGIESGDISFLCCQNLMKYLPQYDDVFPAIAVRVPKAKFIFIRFSETRLRCFRQRMERAFARLGLMAEDHLLFFPPLNAITYAVLNAETDIYLDSIGWSGGNTTFESLPFNKPIVTMPGEFMRGRHTAAILRMMGMEELIAADKEQYIAIAARLATDRQWYEAVSGRIAANKQQVYGDLRCIRVLEKFLETSVRMVGVSRRLRELVGICEP